MAEAFELPKRIVLAFDGSANARRAVQALASQALSIGLPVLVAMVGLDTTLARRQFEEARIALAASGLAVESELVAGETQRVLPDRVNAP